MDRVQPQNKRIHRSRVAIWIAAFAIVALFGLLSTFYAVATAEAQSPTQTPTADSHSAHHPTAMVAATQDTGGMSMPGTTNAIATPGSGGMDMGGMMNGTSMPDMSGMMQGAATSQANG